MRAPGPCMSRALIIVQVLATRFQWPRQPRRVSKVGTKQAVQSHVTPRDRRRQATSRGHVGSLTTAGAVHGQASVAFRHDRRQI